MFTAIIENGDTICLLDLQKHKALALIRLKHSFYCPHCHEQVILKIGKIKVPHFAHKSFSQCVYSEPESEVHLQGKRDLYNWLKNQGFEVQMEKYLPEIKQRPDLLVEKYGKVYAVEYQCSTIPIAEIRKRNSGYSSLNLIPVWILGGEPYQKKLQLTSNLFQISDFQWSFAQYTSKLGMHIYSYSPKAKRFILLSHLTPVTIRKVFAQQMILPLSTLDFPIHIQSVTSKQFNYDFWFVEKKKWLQKKIVFAKNLHDPFLSTVYLNRHSPLLLPPEIGIPVKFMGICKTYSIIWQYYLWCDELNKLRIGDETTLSKMEQHFKKRVRDGSIKMRNFPFINVSFHKQMIYHYVKTLSNLGVLQEVKKGRFVMNKSISFPNNIEEVRILEENVRNQLKTQL